ncbi:MAG TPA: class I SAM-dependent rRNA methyltransferase [Candidatus Udaeobacter sp.]|nr:class I SAM-dependent rRNA methyltransferase [Candidatus Udaeobacter sp.]
MAGIVVKPRARILHGHDWVFSSEVLKVFGKPADGDVISLKDGKDRLIGSAIYNSKSQIVARRFSRRKQDLDLDFLKRRIAQASEYRARRDVDPKLCRVAWSESDGLPGLIVDRYGDHFVIQTFTLAMDMRKDLIVDAIIDLFQSSASLRLANIQAASGTHALPCIIERNDAPVRRAEGLALHTGVLRGNGPSQIEIEIENVKFELDLLRGHKTGFYLDQRYNYPAVAGFAQGRRVLDCFTNQGAFALTCARAGAADVTGVEESSENIAAAKRNAARNDLKVQWIEQDVFHFLRSAERAGAQYDLIVLDPPSFTKTRSGLRDAMRGYRELHMRAFKLLSKQGLLATFSCSHHVSDTAFSQTIADALVDARRSARRLRRFEQGPDHPVLPTIPETEYFKGFLVEMMPGR